MSNRMLQRKVLSEQIREKIMEDILSGELKPGERLVENTLAKKYGVSQAPVREALKGLEAQSLVAVEPYKGTTVKQMGRESLKEYFVVRSVLEGFQYVIIDIEKMENITEEELEELERLLEQMIAAAEEHDYEKRGELNKMFHMALIEASHNSLLVNICKNVRLGSWSRITSKNSKMDPNRIATRHRKMLELLRQRDADGIEKALQEHIKESFENFNSNFFMDEEE